MQLPLHVYRATLPDGTVVTRKTRRVYTHVVAVLGIKYPPLAGMPSNAPRSLTWRVGGWAGREDLAIRNSYRFAPNKTAVIAVDNPRS